MYKVSKFKNIETSIIDSILEIKKVFEIIKDGDSSLKHIKYARTFEKGTNDYDDVKKSLIPTFRFNFHFKDKAINKNIGEPTGLIYIDADYIDEIPKSEYIFAKWKSLSQTGFSILVKVDNLSLNNFSDSYNTISSLLQIESDLGARKPIQQTVLSHDPDIYINYESTVFNCLNIKKVLNPIKQKKKERCLTGNDTFSQVQYKTKVRFNNIDDYFIDNDLSHIVFREKMERLCIPFIPKKVEEGNRNRYLFTYLSQIVALNSHISKAYVKVLSESVNLIVMRPKLSNDEQYKIIDSIFNLKDSNELTMFYNKKRRIIFNPNYKISFKEKMAIVNRELGSMAREKTTEKIYVCLEGWDFKSNGKITQSKVANLIGLHVSTVKRYWSNFISYVKELNKDYLDTYSSEQKDCCYIDDSKCYISPPLTKQIA